MGLKVPEGQGRVVGPELFARAQAIRLRTRRMVTTSLSGGYRSRYQGQGIEFAETRPYQPGDDVRSIDWNVTARTGEPAVKTYAEERELALHFIVDTGPSMAFGSRRFTKRELAARFTALLGFVAMRENDSIGLTLFGSQLGRRLAGERGAKQVGRMTSEVLRAAVDPAPSDIEGVLKEELGALRRHSLVFLISDFLSGLPKSGKPPWEDALARLSGRHDVIAVRPVDPLEHELPEAACTEWTSMLGAGHGTLDPRSKAHRDAWRDAFQEREAILGGALARARSDSITIGPIRDVVGPTVEFFQRRVQTRMGAAR